VKLPDSLEAVVSAFQKLPGVGSKSAQRMALHLLKEGPAAMEQLGDLLRSAAHSVGFCQTCGAFTDRPVCAICANPERDNGTLVVLAEASNVLSFERSGHFRGRYHVLGGALSLALGAILSIIASRELMISYEVTDLSTAKGARPLTTLKPLASGVSGLPQS